MKRVQIIARNTDYAINALLAIARKKGKVVAVGELAEELSIPRPFLRKILQSLNRAGFLKSYRGKDGGFRLTRPVEKIYVSELIEFFQGALALNDCSIRHKPCPRIKGCALRKKTNRIEAFIIDEIRKITLKSLQPS